MTKQYDPMCHDRPMTIDGVTQNWRWIAQDSGAWDGPLGDWETSHKFRYFEHVKKFDVCIQAGGNMGMYPRLLAQRFQWVYTFEPDPLNFYCLVNNCQVDNVVKIQGALGETHDMVVIQRNSLQNAGMHRVREAEFARIPQYKIDDLNLDACDFIQLDVELYEIHAIKGAEQTIAKFHPVIAVENCNAEILDFLKQYNYTPASQSKMDTVLVSNG